MALTKTQMFTKIATDLADNTTGAITQQVLREVLTQLADSPIYAAEGVGEAEVLRASSSVAQAPSAVDTPLQVAFGAAQGAPSDPVSISSAGLVTFNQAGNYAVRVKLQCGRTGASGTSILLSRLVLGGAQLGSAACVKLTQTDATTPTDSRVVMNTTAGQTLQVQIMRDSAGSNFGGIYPQAATVTTWGTAPSALLVISRLEAV